MIEEQNNDEKEQVYHCTKCNATVNKDDDFCPKCGEKFASPEELKKTDQGILYHCTQCRATVGKDDEFCPKCGAKFAYTVIKDSPKTYNGFQFHKIFLFILMLVFGCFVLMSAYTIFGGKEANMYVWAIKTEQIKVNWLAEILLLYAIPSLIVNSAVVYGIYNYLFSKNVSR